MLSGQFDVEFESWLQEQLESIKSLTQPTKQTPLSSVSGRSDVIMSRGHDINRNKHGGGGVDYYQFAYDEDESFDDLSSVDESTENDDVKRRRRLSRILGDDFHDFGDSISGLDDQQPGDMFDSGINRNSTDGIDAIGKRTFLQLSTASLEFSDTVSMASETGSDFFGPKEAAAAISSLDDVDLQRERGRDNSIDGFIEFQRAGNQSSGQGQRTADVEAQRIDEVDDPLQYELCKSDKKQVPGALISAISGRRHKSKSGTGNSQAAALGGIAIKFYKTDVSADDVFAGEEFLDDDDILVYPQRHQLPVSSDDVNDKETMMSSVNDQKYPTDHLIARSVLPADLSLDIMSPEDPYNPLSSGFDDINNDDGAFHGGDLDPIFKVKSEPAGSPVSRVSQQLAKTLSVTGKTGRIPWSKKYRCLMIVVGVVIGILVAGGVAVAMYFAVR